MPSYTIIPIIEMESTFYNWRETYTCDLTSNFCDYMVWAFEKYYNMSNNVNREYLKGSRVWIWIIDGALKLILLTFDKDLLKRNY